MAWYEKWAAMAITAAIGVAGYYGIPWSRMDITIWAYWVGAVGAIGSIIGAYFLGERQSKAALRLAANVERLTAFRRGGSILAVTDAVESHTSRILKAFNDEGFYYLILLMQHDGKIMQSYIDALSAIPVHELGSYKSVAALLRIRTSMVYFQIHIEKCVAQAERSRNQYTGGVADFHRIDPSSIRHCGEEISVCNQTLRCEVEKLRVVEITV
ncbi:hypothetical protein [Janthinobacterium sp.]|uniref:hypothetical protein n=1 Tax=Janthinobacterium sp. TaxID=1871054 RepID=UPI00289E51AD|nr:hypothetical protein [Janthinobacterium sp.]